MQHFDLAPKMYHSRMFIREVAGFLLAVLASGPLCLSSFAQAEGREMEAIGKPQDPQAVLGKMFPPGSTHQSFMVPMRDGVKLATDVFLPPGPGPWPVVFSRGYYGRMAGAVYADRAGSKKGGIAFVCQDARGVYDSEGKGASDYTQPDFEINDCADSLAWIASQPWCNGRIGMAGASGNGIGAAIAYLAKSPHLTMASSDISAAFPYYYWGFENGVRRDFLSWFRNAGGAPPEWPKPTVPKIDVKRWDQILNQAAQGNKTPLVMTTGWYDLNSEGPLDYFSKFAESGKVFLTVRPRAHGADPKYTWPQKGSPRMPALADVLAGKDVSQESTLVYYLMGDFRDPNSPGNVYKTTHVWPVPHTPTPFYFTSEGGLSRDKPTGDAGVVSFDYDPKDPAPAVGGNGSVTPSKTGPADQRPLNTRKDVVRFVSAPLDTPLEITGKLRGDLYVTTDVPDTLFVVKVVDIHPDGYEMLLRESAVMGRYATDFAGDPQPLQKGKVYHLNLDLGSTAVLMNSGHRLGVLVTSSSKGSYEVHPNSFDPVNSYDNAPIAHQGIYASNAYPSSVSIPVVK